MVRFLTFVGLLCWLPLAQAEWKLPSLFTPNMVLQRDMEVPIWGWGDPGEKILVSFGTKSGSAVADADGRWEVKLEPLSASSVGQTLRIFGQFEHRAEIENVLVGDVWICSGQSNMQFALHSAIDAQNEIAAANFPEIRLFTVPNTTSVTPQADCAGKWEVCTPNTAAYFSAVGYFFGRALFQDLNVPMGLIGSSWGGTLAEAWTSGPTLRKKMPEFIDGLDFLKATVEGIAAYDSAIESVKKLEQDGPAAAKRAAEDEDKDWPTMKLPGNWESLGLPGLDGIVWYRKTVMIPETWAGKDLIMHLGPIDDADLTFFNGAMVGAMGTRDKPRHYAVSGKQVKAGPNVVAIQVTDMTGEGGLWGQPAESMYLEFADKPTQEGEPGPTVSLAGEWRYQVAVKVPPRVPGLNSPNHPSLLYNAMIAPLTRFGITGAIWYQGESNVAKAMQYRTLLPTLIADWREAWAQGDFPFLVVQLTNYNVRAKEPGPSQWAELREAQAMTAAKDPNTGLAVTIDIGEANNIHPLNKQDVGKRLALAALKIAYEKEVVYSGPTYQKMEVENGVVTVHFDHAHAGLETRGEGPLVGFAIAGKDGIYAWADAKIDGDTVVLSAAAVPAPVRVRYAWAENPACNLYNGAGLPAVPFRTDAPPDVPASAP